MTQQQRPTTNFKAQNELLQQVLHPKPSNTVNYSTFWRLLKYTLPYKKRLIIGLLCGVLMASSLFGTFFFMIGVFTEVFPKPGDSAQTIVDRVQCIQVDSTLTEEQKTAALEELLLKNEKPDLIKDKIDSLDKVCQSIGVPSPVSYDATTKVLMLGDDIISFKTEENGRTAWQIFAFSVFGLILTFTLKNFFTFLNRYYIRWVGIHVIQQLRNDLFNHLVNQSLRFYGQTQIGALMSRVSSDISAIETGITLVVADMVRAPLEILACTAGIVYASLLADNMLLPMVLFIGVPVCIVPVIVIGKRVRRIFRDVMQNNSLTSSCMYEVFSNILLVKATHTEETEVNRFKEINTRFVRMVSRALRYELMISPITEAVTVSATLAFLVFSYANGLNLANLAALTAPAILAYQPIKQISQLYTTLLRSLAAADRYFALLDIDMSLPAPENPVPLKQIKDKIKFDHVTFSYNEDGNKILDDVSFEIPRGHVVAVVGETGSGKTTIANLIARFYDVTAGSVTIDGTDVRDVPVEDIRALVGLVTQTPILFNTTIAENIAYGVPGATQEQIEAAAKKANAHQFIVDGRHPKGYETVVGDRGAVLSGGEKQRIAIARAILRNSPILILDEATSALDTVTEKLVQDAINAAMEDRTVFAIAHRLSTIQHANMILVVERGHIIESGTHKELYAKGGKYRALCDMQFQGAMVQQD